VHPLSIERAHRRRRTRTNG